jgi:serine/threonine-protein kinase HipA
MAEYRLEHIAGPYHTFFTKRFDRKKQGRIHFASAMTITGKNEELSRDETPSYQSIVEFIQFPGIHIEEDLHRLWKRMIFNILISNIDDHLINHGFILTSEGWCLSPACDINPPIEKVGLALNIDMDNNSPDIDLARSVSAYFRSGKKEMENILNEVQSSALSWQKIASEIGIPLNEQILMAAAFKV